VVLLSVEHPTIYNGWEQQNCRPEQANDMASVITPSPLRSALPKSDQLYELVDGVRTEKIVSAYASWIAGRLDRNLGPFVEASGIGTSVVEMVFVLDNNRDLRRRPDLAVIGAGKWPVGEAPPPRGDWAVIPDLVVEVVSPSNEFEEILGKLQDYFSCGVAEVWIVAPLERLIQVYNSLDEVRTLGSGHDLSSDLVPGWSMPVNALLPHDPKASSGS
jgi:Uma2 family endonuclease